MRELFLYTYAMFNPIDIKEIKELIDNLKEPYLITDGINILDKTIDISSINYLLISAADEDITIKKENDQYYIVVNKAELNENTKEEYSPFSEGDKDPNSNFCDITPDGARLEEFFDITIGDIIHRKEDQLRSEYNVKEADGYLYFQRIPSIIFEAMDITRVKYRDGRCIEASILMLLKENTTGEDKRKILEIINQATTDTLEVPGDDNVTSFTWNIKSYNIKASIEDVDKREYAIVAVTRE